MPMPDNELQALRRAVKSLEHPGLSARLHARTCREHARFNSTLIRSMLSLSLPPSPCRPRPGPMAHGLSHAGLAARPTSYGGRVAEGRPVRGSAPAHTRRKNLLMAPRFFGKGSRMIARTDLGNRAFRQNAGW